MDLIPVVKSIILGMELELFYLLPICCPFCIYLQVKQKEKNHYNQSHIFTFNQYLKILWQKILNKEPTKIIEEQRKKDE